MEIYFKKLPSEISERTREKAERNLQKLSRLVKEGNYEARVEVEVVRESSSHTSPNEWKAGINLDVGGDRINSSARGKTGEKALSNATQELKAELKRIKEKSDSNLKRRKSVWKFFADGLGA